MDSLQTTFKPSTQVLQNRRCFHYGKKIEHKRNKMNYFHAIADICCIHGPRDIVCTYIDVNKLKSSICVMIRNVLSK
jgi:hypothetical protein